MNGWKITGLVFLFLLASVVIYTCNTGKKVVGKWVDNSVDNSIVSYENYQNIYNTCSKLNTDLGIMQSTPADDPQFAQFSKTQRVNAIKMNLNRWVEEYNAKSKMINKSLWKSGKLPYQLTVDEFNNYNK